ncbi:unnamed protein product [Adineta ricciae]|uniref:Aminoglycoside phosphotransferase domain-containing protein n=1 Tax=Adineta ricciae TaxID=249248 RepID=A0A815M633_ADIRI|nr:unnamed protein product [Adineta ricciae]
MEDRVRQLLSEYYNLTMENISQLEGGYCLDETYRLITSDQMIYVVKYIQYDHSLQYLQSILKFQNVLHDVHQYPCAKLIPSKENALIIDDNERLLFVQRFIEGTEPSREILDKNDDYLQTMGRLLAQWRCASREYVSEIHMQEEYEEFTNEWWERQDVKNIDPFLASNFFQCKQFLIHLTDRFERGLIHNDFHTNNSILTDNSKIYIIDFVDACQSLFIADLATSLFHLLVDKQNGKHRAKAFLRGYQQLVALSTDEIDTLDYFVRLKLTLSVIEDVHESIDMNNSWIQSCFDLLHRLNNDSTLVKTLVS